MKRTYELYLETLNEIKTAPFGSTTTEMQDYQRFGYKSQASYEADLRIQTGNILQDYVGNGIKFNLYLYSLPTRLFLIALRGLYVLISLLITTPFMPLYFLLRLIRPSKKLKNSQAGSSKSKLTPSTNDPQDHPEPEIPLFTEEQKPELAFEKLHGIPFDRNSFLHKQELIRLEKKGAINSEELKRHLEPKRVLTGIEKIARSAEKLFELKDKGIIDDKELKDRFTEIMLKEVREENKPL